MDFRSRNSRLLNLIGMVSLSIFLIPQVFGESLNETEIEKIISNTDFENRLSIIEKNQNEIINNLESQEKFLETLEENLIQSLTNQSTSIWASATLGTLIAVGLAMIGMLISISLAIKPVLKEKGHSKKYAWKWVGVGVMVGALLAILINTFLTWFNLQ